MHTLRTLPSLVSLTKPTPYPAPYPSASLFGGAKEKSNI